MQRKALCRNALRHICRLDDRRFARWAFNLFAPSVDVDFPLADGSTTLSGLERKRQHVILVWSAGIVKLASLCCNARLVHSYHISCCLSCKSYRETSCLRSSALGSFAGVDLLTGLSTALRRFMTSTDQRLDPARTCGAKLRSSQVSKLPHGSAF